MVDVCGWTYAPAGTPARGVRGPHNDSGSSVTKLEDIKAGVSLEGCAQGERARRLALAPVTASLVARMMVMRTDFGMNACLGIR